MSQYSIFFTEQPKPGEYYRAVRLTDEQARVEQATPGMCVLAIKPNFPPHVHAARES